MAHSSHRHRSVLGVALTGQTIALLLAVVTVAVLTGMAVLNWLERM